MKTNLMQLLRLVLMVLAVAGVIYAMNKADAIFLVPNVF